MASPLNYEDALKAHAAHVQAREEEQSFDDLHDLLFKLKRSDSPSLRAVALIYEDLSDRQGLGNALDEMGEDIKIEMVEGWVRMVVAGIAR